MVNSTIVAPAGIVARVCRANAVAGRNVAVLRWPPIDRQRGNALAVYAARAAGVIALRSACHTTAPDRTGNLWGNRWTRKIRADARMAGVADRSRASGRRAVLAVTRIMTAIHLAIEWRIGGRQARIQQALGDAPVA